MLNNTLLTLNYYNSLGTAKDFQPVLAKYDALERLKQCPAYCSGLRLVVQHPFWYVKKKRVVAAVFGRKFRYF
ncbi:hypothetical protein FQR65_LT03948 [Abscondita terminalis]|nr:hypothetical protein FQR65_LT03948 [Abscondita terminalis]